MVYILALYAQPALSSRLVAIRLSIVPTTSWIPNGPYVLLVSTVMDMVTKNRVHIPKHPLWAAQDRTNAIALLARCARRMGNASGPDAVTRKCFQRMLLAVIITRVNTCSWTPIRSLNAKIAAGWVRTRWMQTPWALPRVGVHIPRHNRAAQAVHRHVWDVGDHGISVMEAVGCLPFP